MDENLAAYLHALAGDAPDCAYLEVRYRVARDTLAADFLPAHDITGVAASVISLVQRCADRRRYMSGERRLLDAEWTRPPRFSQSGHASGTRKPRDSGVSPRALCRTRTGDPFLTIVRRGRNGGALAVTSDTK